MRIAFKITGALVHVEQGVGGSHTGFHFATLYCCIVLYGGIGGLGDSDQAGNTAGAPVFTSLGPGWVEDRIGNAASDRKISTTGTSGSDSEETGRLSVYDAACQQRSPDGYGEKY